MKQRFRLKHSQDFKRVRSDGKAYSHPFFVFLVCQGIGDHPRLGISVSKRYGSAVERNRAKRRIREICSARMDKLSSNYDMMVIVRLPMKKAGYNQLTEAVDNVFSRAKVLTYDE